MFDMQEWQWAVVGITAVAVHGYMIPGILGVFGGRTSAIAQERGATDFESALVSGQCPHGAHAFDAFSYRVGARFAGKTRIVIHADRVAVAGPRVPRNLYRLWIMTQAIALALMPVFAVWALLSRSSVAGISALAVAVLSVAVSFLGAGIWPGLGEMAFLTRGAYHALEFPLTAVSDVAIGEGWARGGMNRVLLPYKRGVDMMATDHSVSFFAPDETGREVRYALHIHQAEDAVTLARLLEGESALPTRAVC